MNKNWDGRSRKIEVKVNRPGVELRYRKAYMATDPDKAISQSKEAIEQEVGPVLTGTLNASAVSFYGSVQPLAEKKPDGDATNKSGTSATTKLKADINFLVDPHDILFHASNDSKQHCSMQFVLGVFVAEKFVDSTVNQINCDLEPANYARVLQDGMIFRMHTMIPSGKSRLRLLVRDNQTGKMGSLDIPYPNSRRNSRE